MPQKIHLNSSLFILHFSLIFKKWLRFPAAIFLLATATAVITAAVAATAVTEEEDDNKRDDYYPCTVVIKKIAKAIVVHIKNSPFEGVALTIMI